MSARRRNRRTRRERPDLRRVASVAADLAQRGVLLLGVAAVIAVILLGLEALRALPVERIVVAGKLENLRHAAVREALADELDAGLIFLDLARLRERLEAMPWVYRAELRRRFPGTLEVRVLEQVPIARWGDTAFLNHEARVIEVDDAARWSDLPQIRGPEGSAARLMTHYRRLRLDLASLDLVPVALVEDDFRQLSVTLANGVSLQLGDRDFRLRLQRFLRLWREQLAQADAAVARVDLRYETGAAVAFEEVEQLAALSETVLDR
ncbi:MAG: FtsQ-type POTRA domain-containing protein [Halieaceae bacterium]|jgi:cell division protein FtsQ|nr:FtsQ-type POTRA domain-containing protein [Halieaceae bacterium]